MPKKSKLFDFDFLKGKSLDEYFMGDDPRRHKDYVRLGGKKENRRR